MPWPPASWTGTWRGPGTSRSRPTSRDGPLIVGLDLVRRDGEVELARPVRAGQPPVAAVTVRADHHEPVAPRQLGMVDGAVLAAYHEVLAQPERLAQPLDHRGGLLV